jgi:hypothetical protein
MQNPANAEGSRSRTRLAFVRTAHASTVALDLFAKLGSMVLIRSSLSRGEEPE